MQLRFILFIALSIIVSLFAILNAGIMTVNLVFVQYKVSASIVILVSVMLGSMLTILFGLSRSFKSMLKNKEVRKQINVLRKEADDNAFSAQNWKTKYEAAAKEVAALQKPEFEVPPPVDDD